MLKPSSGSMAFRVERLRCHAFLDSWDYDLHFGSFPQVPFDLNLAASFASGWGGFVDASPIDCRETL